MAESTRGHHLHYGDYDGHRHDPSENEGVSQGFGIANPLLGANAHPQSSFSARKASTFGDSFYAGGQPVARLQGGGDSLHRERMFQPTTMMAAPRNEWQAHHAEMMHGEGRPVPAMSPADQLAMYNLVRSQQQLLQQMQMQNAHLAQHSGFGPGYLAGHGWNSMAMNPPHVHSTFPRGDTTLPAQAYAHDERLYQDHERWNHYEQPTYREYQRPGFMANETPCIGSMGELGAHHQLSDQPFIRGLPSYRQTPFHGFVEPSPSALTTPQPQPARLPPISNFAPARRRLVGPGDGNISRSSSPWQPSAHHTPVAGSVNVRQAHDRVDSAQPTPVVPQEDVRKYAPPAPMLQTNTAGTVDQDPPEQQSTIKLEAHGHVPAIADYALSHKVLRRFGDFSPALQRFNGIVDQYNNDELNAGQFFSALYELFYWSGSSELLDVLKEHIPSQFGVTDVVNFYEELQNVAKDRAKKCKEVAAMRDALRTWARKKAARPTKGDEPASAGDEGQQVAPASKKTRRKSRRASKAKAVSSLIVKLPVDASALLAKLQASDNTDETARTRKKRPRNGFKASERLSEPTEVSENESPEADREAPPERPDLVVAEDPETGGDILINKGTEQPLPASQTPSCWVDHFGPVYKTRWQILARDSNPYIHEPCKQGFEHPSLVKQHHPPKDPAKGEVGNWCAVMLERRESGDWQEWNHHESCKVTETNINYTMVRDGYVINDRESLDKIERAVNKGLEFKDQARLWDEAQNGQADVSTTVAEPSAEPSAELVKKTETDASPGAMAGGIPEMAAAASTINAKTSPNAVSTKTPGKKVPAKRANPSPSKYGLTPQKRRYVVAGAGDDDKEAEARAIEILSSSNKGRK